MSQIKIAKLILLYLATCIVVLHSLLPHDHHGDMGKAEHMEEHTAADGLLDYVLLMFHVDLGDGHMETFQSGSDYDFDTQYSVDVFPDLITHKYHRLLLLDGAPSQSPQIVYYNVPIVQRHNISPLSFRGPPSFV